MNSTIQKQEDGTITLSITIPKEEVVKAREDVLEKFSKETEVPGFRKGKAPKKIIEKNIDKDRVNEEVLKILLPKYYTEAVKQHNINPILNPRIHIGELEDGKDIKFSAETCEAPAVVLGSYKQEIKNVTAKSKIVVPGKPQEEVSFDAIAGQLLESASVKIPKVIIEQETQRLLSQTLDEIKRLGLTLEQYLSSTGRAIEDLKREYEQKAENDIKLEFTLQKIAEEENITVEPKEIDEAIAKAKDDTERRSLEANKYLLAGILRQQKTLDFLKNL